MAARWVPAGLAMTTPGRSRATLNSFGATAHAFPRDPRRSRPPCWSSPARGCSPWGRGADPAQCPAAPGGKAARASEPSGRWRAPGGDGAILTLAGVTCSPCRVHRPVAAACGTGSFHRARPEDDARARLQRLGTMTLPWLHHLGTLRLDWFKGFGRFWCCFIVGEDRPSPRRSHRPCGDPATRIAAVAAWWLTTGRG
jgi:hypothetical protein